MNFEEITQQIRERFSDSAIEKVTSLGLMPYVIVKKEFIERICNFLYNHPQMYFDYLACMTGIDNGPSTNTMEIVYNLNSIPFNTSYCIKVIVERNTENEVLPEIDSVSEIWRTANWHEREIFDLLGVKFRNHSDLRRILMPADWIGYPLRKDYKELEEYHSITVKY